MAFGYPKGFSVMTLRLRIERADKVDGIVPSVSTAYDIVPKPLHHTVKLELLLPYRPGS